MACYRGSTLRYVIRYGYAQSWEDLGILQSLRGSRRPRDNRGPDTRNVIWFDTTRRGDGGCTVVYIHGGVAACLRCTVCGKGGNIIVYLLSVLYLSLRYFSSFPRVTDNQSESYAVSRKVRIIIYINTYINKYIYTG